MNKNNNKMDLLGNAPVPQALMALGIPIMIGMLINALYNLVDAYFIGGLGESQMGAISIAFPLGQVVVGLGLMFGNGAASYLSRLLGRGDREAASKVASTALYSSVCIGAVIIIGTAIFLKPILTMLGATDTIMPCDDSISYTAYSNFSPTHCMDKIFLTDSVPLWLLSYAVHSCLSYLLPCFSICACVILLIITHFNAFRIVLIYDKIYALSEVI